MNWSIEDITDRPFLVHELENESRTLNGYHVYCRTACNEYSTLSDEDKIVFILATSHLEVSEFEREENLLPEGLDTTDFEKIKLVNDWWNRLAQDIKVAWSERAKRLNLRPLIGQFDELPVELALDLIPTQELLRVFLRQDLVILHRSIKRAIRNKNQRDLYKKAVKIPYAIQVEQQVYRTATVSSLLMFALFGENFNKLSFDNELISSNCDPFTFHIASKTRMKEIFSIDDTCLSVLEDLYTRHKFYLTGYGILKNKQGLSVKAYAWDETDSTVDFIFNDSDSSTKVIKFDRPFLHKNDLPPRNILGYICDVNVVDGYTLTQYNPVGLYLSYKNTSNFKILSAKLCIDENGRVVDKRCS